MAGAGAGAGVSRRLLLLFVACFAQLNLLLCVLWGGTAVWRGGGGNGGESSNLLLLGAGGGWVRGAAAAAPLGAGGGLLQSANGRLNKENRQMEVRMNLKQRQPAPGEGKGRNSVGMVAPGDGDDVRERSPMDGVLQNKGDAAAAGGGGGGGVIRGHVVESANQRMSDGVGAVLRSPVLSPVEAVGSHNLLAGTGGGGGVGQKPALVEEEGEKEEEYPGRDIHLLLLVLVKTGPDYFVRRNVTRALWLNACRAGQLPSGVVAGKADGGGSVALKALGVECLFVTGESEDQHVNARLARERAQHGDLFVAQFQDRYGSMTSKTQWTLVWSLERYKSYDYVMLVDDDAYVSFQNLVPWLLEQPRKRFYAGHSHFNRRVVHCHLAPDHPNCIKQEAYMQLIYPPFASGFAYVMSRDTVLASTLQTMARLAQQGLPGNIEDAMMGVLLAERGISLRPEEGFVHWVDEQRRCPRLATVLVVGNAPANVLKLLASNERQTKAICTGLHVRM